MVLLIMACDMVPESLPGAAPSKLKLDFWGGAIDANHCLGRAAVRHETMAAASEAMYEAIKRTDARGGRVVGWAALSWAL